MNLSHPPKVKHFKERVREDPTLRDKYIKKIHSWDSKRTDSKLKLCTNCKKVWETCKRTQNNKPVLHYNYYDDFPTLGKRRKVCPRCRAQDEKLF